MGFFYEIKMERRVLMNFVGFLYDVVMEIINMIEIKIEKEDNI